MCGIAGIIYRNPDLYANLGTDLLSLAAPLESRGPDSCGVALYGNRAGRDQIKLLLRGEADWSALIQWLSQYGQVVQVDDVADERRLTIARDGAHPFDLQQVKYALQQQFPGVHVSSAGQALEIYKEVGAVENLLHKYRLGGFAGTHGIGHTRMATESVVDIDHSHPFTARFDLAIVHNGQISNYYKLRFQLERAGMMFETDNDSEAIAHYLSYQFLQGESLESALEKLLRDIDGTYTFLVATPDKIGLVRDKFAAKPAVIYESDEMVAIASEYRALLNLTRFDPTATLREPDASEVNVWSVTSATPALQLSGVG